MAALQAPYCSQSARLAVAVGLFVKRQQMGASIPYIGTREPGPRGVHRMLKDGLRCYSGPRCSDSVSPTDRSR